MKIILINNMFLGTDVESPIKKFKGINSFTRLKSSSIPPSPTTTRLDGVTNCDADDNVTDENESERAAFKRKCKN